MQDTFSGSEDAYNEDEEVPEYVSTEDLNTYVEYMKMKRDEQLIEMERAKKELAQLRRYVKNLLQHN